MTEHQQILAWRRSWRNALASDEQLKLYALVDPAQDQSILQRIAEDHAANECLFGYGLDTPIAKATPRLVAIASETAGSLLPKLLRQMPLRPVATLLGARCELPELVGHLRETIDVQLKGIDSMFLALWDPAILGTLCGVSSDKTLHVAGPVLTPEQSLALFGPIQYWWYWDRQGNVHDAVLGFYPTDELPSELPLVLDAEQTEMLVEASVPDHLLYHLATNQPELLDRLAFEQRYPFIRQQLQRARDYGLRGTGDLLNYVSIALAFGATFNEQPAVNDVLIKLKGGEITFNQAMKELPEKDMEQCAQAPTLL